MLVKIAVSNYCNEILQAETGIDVVKMCQTNPDIDLILLDIKMLLMDRYDAAREICKLNKQVFIINKLLMQ